MTRIQTALVIGGGIAGPVAAMALRRAGIDATVYEAHHGTADHVGAQLGLAPNGLNALGVLGLDETVRRIATPVSAMVIESWTGKTLAQFGEVPGPPIMHVVSRAELYRALVDETARRGVRVEHGKRLVDATDTGDAVTATFADGSRASADVLIGADGVRSVVRGLIDPSRPQPRFTGLLGFGGWVAETGPDGGGLNLASTNGAMHMSYGKRAFFAYAVQDDGRTGWFANLPSKRFLTLAEAQAVGGADWLRVLREAFAGDRTPAPQILRRVHPDELVIVGGLEILPAVPVWHRGRMVLVGDAAHAPSPSSGQGASQAIESAVQLARCLRDLPASEAFAAYEGLRRKRVERIIAMAERTNSDKAAGPVARVVRDLFLPMAMKVLAKPEKMAWQTDYHIDWEAPVDRVVLPV